MPTTITYRECDAREIVRQVGLMNLLAISGGRAIMRPTGVTLPVGHGYRVDIDLNFMDYYHVRRVFTRGGKSWVKKEWDDIDCFQVGEIAYQASCYLDA